MLLSKPPQGAQINRSHPLARGVRMSYLLNGPSRWMHDDARPSASLVEWVNATVEAGAHGPCFDVDNILENANFGSGASIPLPTQRATVLAVFEKTDNSDRSFTFFTGNTTSTNIFRCHAPGS